VKKAKGDRVSNIQLTAVNGSRFDLDSIRGKRCLIAFFRFAGCPFCNLRVHDLVEQYHAFGSNFTIVAIFDSTLKDLRRHAMKHNAPFPILADDTKGYYQEYGIERSFWRTLKGAVVRFPTVLYAIFVKGYVPTSFGGNLMTMPADFLVNEDGVIEVAHYGRDEGDHIPIERVMQFSHGSVEKA
jgi:peroxiredoxin Q/BCP